MKGSNNMINKKARMNENIQGMILLITIVFFFVIVPMAVANLFHINLGITATIIYFFNIMVYGYMKRDITKE